MSNSSKPVAKVGFPITGAIFRNEKNGRAFYSTTFYVNYKDEKGHRQRGNTFSFDELLPLAKIADQAHTQICELRNADRQAAQTERPPTDD